ncbi:ring-hydroxylating oxygenase subunit alpha [Acidocella aquatica]|uniref:Ring-hydroxylating oxygenase subunit alpha n=1 Tax=Acidocella aquatica TaxID=1922313 RepID=A0ABQ6A7V9_9PROT|nr:SRPBCC family protein [Acidocella aquatica]GLR68574.1 ring-hydroxylating oxygenase subunit alpha [Acidocella aquatica]
MSLIQAYGNAAEAMISYVDNHTTDLAGSVMPVPVKNYTDPEIFERELDLIFKRLPLLAALTIEMPKPGDFKTLSMVGKPVLLTRGKDGVARAFLNVCTHRGNKLAMEKTGNCSRFSCAYHAWTYSNDGRLLGIAERAKFGEVDTSTLNLTALPCQEVAGLIFVTLTPGVEMDMPAFLGGMLEDLEGQKFKDWYYVGSKEIEGANWKIAYDGYLEGYHFSAAHPKTIAPRSYTNIMHFDIFGPHMRVGYPTFSIGKLKDLPREEWGQHENDGYDFVRTLFPNVSIFVAPELTQIAQLLPGPTAAENRTVLHYLAKVAPVNEEEEARLQSFSQFIRDVVNEEDYMLGLKVQEGLASGALDHVVFGRNERGNQVFHKWVDYYLRNDPTAPRPNP